MPRRLPRKQAGAKASDAIADALAGLSGADRVITFIERFLRHSKGFRAGEPFVLADWQRDEIVRPLYDTVTEDGRRRYRQGYISMARKSGKTCLAAALALYHLLVDEDMEPGIREVYAAAASRDQASLLFIQAADFVNGSAELSARCVVSRATKRIVDRVSRSFLRAVSADANTAHGLNTAFVVLDEIAQQPNRDLFDVLQTSQGARRNPLLLAIGTAGHDQHSIAYELYRHGKRCLEAPGMDPSFFACIKELPEGLDWADERNWIIPNPGLGDFRDLEELRDMRDRALLLPSLAGTFQNLYCNQWTEAESTWLDMAAWDACSGTVADGELHGASAYAGLDLASTTDLTALSIVFRLPDDRVAVKHWAWIPEAGIVERERRDGVPYRAWAERGIVELTPGNVIDGRIIARRCVEECTRWGVRHLAFDRWGSRLVVPILQEAGLDIFEHGQGFRDMSPPTKYLQELVLSRRLLHGGCPLLRWQASSVTVATDPAGNIKPVKPSALAYARRIDSIVATVMALSPAMAHPPVDDSRLFAELIAV